MKKERKVLSTDYRVNLTCTLGKIHLSGMVQALYKNTMACNANQQRLILPLGSMYSNLRYNDRHRSENSISTVDFEA